MNNSKTPYQGPSRCFGYFKCGRCSRSWQSGNSWANKGQQCQRCLVMIYPYKQESLVKPSDNKIDTSKSHDVSKCEKCQNLGRSCRGYYSRSGY